MVLDKTIPEFKQNDYVGNPGRRAFVGVYTKI